MTMIKYFSDDVDYPKEKWIKYEYQLQRLLNKVNKVTAPYRHGRKVRNEDMDELVKRQIEVEKEIRKL